MPNQPIYPFPPNPVLIDPAGSGATQGSAGPANSAGFATNYPPILFNGALYQILFAVAGASNHPPFFFRAFRSSDKGTSWVLLDSGNSPTQLDAAVTLALVFDGAHTFTVCYMPTGGLSPNVAGAVQFVDFDVQAETWGAPYGATGAPVVWHVNQMFFRPDGTRLVITSPNLTLNRLENLNANVYNPGSATWSAPFAIDANVSAPFVAGGANCAAFMDPATGDVLVAGTAENNVSQQLSFAQVVLANNTAPAGSFSVLATDPNVIDETQPAIAGGNWVVSVYDQISRTTQIAFGTPLNAPVWTLYPQADFDPTAPAWVYSRNFTFSADATGLYMAYIGYDGHQAVIRTAYTPNLNAPTTGWTGLTAWSSTNPLFFFNGTIWVDFLSIYRQAGNTFATAQSLTVPQDQGGQILSQYWFGGFAPAVVAASPAPFPIGGAGGGAWCCPQWRSTHRLMSKAFAIDRAKEHFEEWPYSSLLPPADAVAVEGSAAGLQSVAVPVAGATVTVLSYLVPSGFRFFLAAVLADFEGLFLPGDSLFTLSVNRNNTVQSRPVQGFTRQPVPLGSWQTGRLWEIEDPYEFAPLDLLEWRAENVNLNPGPPNTYVAGLFGWLVPVVR